MQTEWYNKSIEELKDKHKDERLKFWKKTRNDAKKKHFKFQDGESLECKYWTFVYQTAKKEYKKILHE